VNDAFRTTNKNVSLKSCTKDEAATYCIHKAAEEAWRSTYAQLHVEGKLGEQASQI